MTAILILGAAVWPHGPSPTLRRRTLHAAGLYHAGRGRLLIPCGGQGRHGPPEAEVMRALLLGAGVPDAAILQERRSTSTWENLLFARPLLAAQGETRVLIVTDRYHVPRARLAARRMGLTAAGAPPPLRGSHVPTQLRQALREVPALVWYAMRPLR
ncbi:hypothetical protein OG2516_14486 [Oceanicola granulosus HTCC2516]|uniref:DUF218 domain-containing protein n=1 Tax=Oceanicola granulosus (strain ATCC BAA-861 / DSM 15982 / KCTC 12143 / HTCC2516) TaxID=314256 RepID=Q2CEY0_OCEGH|nr:YdcF family protein [Oceanicola granulosus]EAR51230.1 hypothetical protein OG2516_14486 [Oceanicola granulosus HTCC2516]